MKFDDTIVGEITMETAKDFCSRFLSRKATRDISIFLSSTGGDVEGALSMGSAIQSIQRQGFNVHIHVGGVAHSAAVLLLQFADKRTMEAYATLRIHSMRCDYGGSDGPASMTIADLNGELDDLSHSNFTYYDVLQRRSGRDIESIVKGKHLRDDVLLHPQDCLEWNLIDEVIDYSIPNAGEVPDTNSSDSILGASVTQLRPQTPGKSRGRKTSRKKAS